MCFYSPLFYSSLFFSSGPESVGCVPAQVIEFVSQEGHIFVKRMRRVPKRPRPRRTEAEEQEADAQFIDDAEADPAQTAVDALEGTAPEPPAVCLWARVEN